MSERLVKHDRVHKYLGLRLETLATLVKEHPLPDAVDVLGIPHYLSGELWRLVNSLPRMASDWERGKA